ncbi:MAG: exodeoxyribonuclease VII large subunit, partial [Bacteroidota bacterium]
FKETIWVKGEWSDLKSSRGHVYAQLIEKQGEAIIAQSQVVIWNRQLQKLDKQSKVPISELLQIGLEVLIEVKIDFHERFGLKLVVENIDPSFTLGELELKRRRNLEKLQQEGLLDLNKSLQLPLVTQRLAIISGSQAAGYIDFIAHLEQNPYAYRWKIHLYESAVQGKNVVKEVDRAIQEISKRRSEYDAIVVIRGGGSRIDLSAFDEFGVCEAIAQSPLPVFTGIGHEIDESLADLVAFQSFKTPTAVADYLIGSFLQVESSFLQVGKGLQDQCKYLLQRRSVQLSQVSMPLKHLVETKTQQAHYALDRLNTQVKHLAEAQLEQKGQQLHVQFKLLEVLDPAKALKRGFTLTLKDGKVLKNLQALKPSDEIETQFTDGIIQSTIKKIQDDGTNT